MSDLDDLDRSIIRALQDDGRQSNRSVGRRLAISEGTVRLRLKKLEQDELFRLVILRDPAAFGYDCMAYVRFRVQPTMVKTVTSTLCNMEQFFYVSVNLAVFNLFSVVVTRDRAVLNELLAGLTKSLDGIEDYEIFEEIETRRFRYHWVI